jgi:hypothetical protein
VVVVVAWKRILLIVGIVLGVVIVAAGVAYAADAPLEATVEDKNCVSTQPTVSIVTALFGIHHTLEMTHDKCNAIQEGNFVRYHLRSGHTIIFAAKDGLCIFDSITVICSS